MQGGISQVRFPPQLGDFLASSTGNIINIFDVETNKIQKKLQVRCLFLVVYQAFVLYIFLVT